MLRAVRVGGWILTAVLGVIGLAGLPDDWHTWRTEWWAQVLAFIDGDVGRWLCFGIVLCLVVILLWERVTDRLGWPRAFKVTPVSGAPAFVHRQNPTAIVAVANLKGHELERCCVRVVSVVPIGHPPELREAWLEIMHMQTAQPIRWISEELNRENPHWINLPARGKRSPKQAALAQVSQEPIIEMLYHNESKRVSFNYSKGLWVVVRVECDKGKSHALDTAFILRAEGNGLKMSKWSDAPFRKRIALWYLVAERRVARFVNDVKERYESALRD